MIKSGFAFHVHHDVLIEWCYDYIERVAKIEANKPKNEQELRLHLFKLIPVDKLPPELVKAQDVYDEAQDVYGKAYDVYVKAQDVYDQDAYDRDAYDKARDVHNKARDARVKARDVYVKARDACMPDLIELHKELCPDCSWDGKSIFPAGRK